MINNTNKKWEMRNVKFKIEKQKNQKWGNHNHDIWKTENKTIKRKIEHEEPKNGKQQKRSCKIRLQTLKR